MTGRVRIIIVPIDEALKIDQCTLCGGLTVQCVGVAGCPRPTVLCGLPVMVNLKMNPAVTRRVTGRCARSTIVGDNSRVIDVESKIVDSRPTVRPASVGRIVAGSRVLKVGTRPFYTVDLYKDVLLVPEVIGYGAGGTWRMPP